MRLTIEAFAIGSYSVRSRLGEAATTVTDDNNAKAPAVKHVRRFYSSL